LQDHELLALLSDTIRRYSIAPDMLELELTETCLMGDPESAIQLLHNIKELGLRLAMDDFGTGYSSLSYLKRFAMDTLKIDQAFVSGLPDDKQDAAIAATIIAMARNLELKVLAEGVETQAQLDFLKRHGCDEVQGYYFSRPLPAAKIGPLLAAHDPKFH
jgi:FOG: EAL domain